MKSFPLEIRFDHGTVSVIFMPEDNYYTLIDFVYLGFIAL